MTPDRQGAPGLLIAERAPFLELALTSFRPEPIPQTLFWSESDEPFQPDIPMGLQTRLGGRRWPDIKLSDWLMIGAAPCVARSYLEPLTYLYYLPSLLVGVFDNLDYLDWALEGILPFNKAHTPRGKWWVTFSAAVSASQRATLRSFLTTVCSANPTDLREQALLADAGVIWAS